MKVQLILENSSVLWEALMKSPVPDMLVKDTLYSSMVRRSYLHFIFICHQSGTLLQFRSMGGLNELLGSGKGAWRAAGPNNFYLRELSSSRRVRVD